MVVEYGRLLTFHDPFLNRLDNSISFKVEVSQNNLSEAHRWIFNSLVHSISDISEFHNILVGPIVWFSLCSIAVFVTRLIIEHILVHYERLYAHENLGDIGLMGLPVLLLLSPPGPQ